MKTHTDINAVVDDVDVFGDVNANDDSDDDLDYNNDEVDCLYVDANDDVNLLFDEGILMVLFMMMFMILMIMFMTLMIIDDVNNDSEDDNAIDDDDNFVVDDVLIVI